MSCTDGGSAKPVLPHQICSPTNLQLCSNSSATHPTLGACIGNPGIGYASASAQGNLLSRVLCPPGDEVRVLAVWHTQRGVCPSAVPFHLWLPSRARIHSV